MRLQRAAPRAEGAARPVAQDSLCPGARARPERGARGDRRSRCGAEPTRARTLGRLPPSLQCSGWPTGEREAFICRAGSVGSRPPPFGKNWDVSSKIDYFMQRECRRLSRQSCGTAETRPHQSPRAKAGTARLVLSPRHPRRGRRVDPSRAGSATRDLPPAPVGPAIAAPSAATRTVETLAGSLEIARKIARFNVTRSVSVRARN